MLFHHRSHATPPVPVPKSAPNGSNGAPSVTGAGAGPDTGSGAAAAGAPPVDHLVALKVHLHQKLLDRLNLGVVEKMPKEELTREIGGVLREILLEERKALNGPEYARLVEELVDEVVGLGPLEPLLKDPTVSDILVNNHAQVYVERFGRLEPTLTRFKDHRHLFRIINKIVNAVGRRVDEAQPWVDARLPDGSRVNALIPPCAIDGPMLSIRKFAKIPYSVDRLIEIGAMTPEIATVLRGAVQGRFNILISGGTGSGKTTMLNAMSSYISDRERILTIEDTAELQLQQIHVGRLETRPANIEGKGEVSQHDLVRNALRMRPDRIIVGEVRGAEVLDMLQAMNTGHDGSMTTVHANSPRDALTRLENMVCMIGREIPLRSLRAQIAAAIQVVLQLQRFSDGTRRLVSFQEIVGMEGDIVSMQEIFHFERMGVAEDGRVQGRFRATGVRPRFAQRLAEVGMPLAPELFHSGRRLETQGTVS